MKNRTGAKGALLDEYERALTELKSVISDVSASQLATQVDKNTSDLNCVSIQSILTHVVNAGYSYANYIRKFKNAPRELREITDRFSIDNYYTDFSEMLAYTIETFNFFDESEVFQPDAERKILTRWGQTYDIEQLWEHAIVHILRHRRQIERFKKL